MAYYAEESWGAFSLAPLLPAERESLFTAGSEHVQNDTRQRVPAQIRCHGNNITSSSVRATLHPEKKKDSANFFAIPRTTHAKDKGKIACTHVTHHIVCRIKRNIPGTTKSSDPTDHRRLNTTTPGMSSTGATRHSGWVLRSLKLFPRRDGSSASRGGRGKRRSTGVWCGLLWCLVLPSRESGCEYAKDCTRTPPNRRHGTHNHSHNHLPVRRRAHRQIASAHPIATAPRSTDSTRRRKRCLGVTRGAATGSRKPRFERSTVNLF